MSDKPIHKVDFLGKVIAFPRSRIAAVGSRANEQLGIDGNSIVNRHELTSIKALTGYVAFKKNVPETVVHAVVHSEFHVEDIAKLRRDDYERVIKFLVDLQHDLLLVH